MQRSSLIMGAFLGLLALAMPASGNAAAYPDVPFLDDVVLARSQAVTALKEAHASNDPGIVEIDRSYRKLAGDMNGLVDAVASDFGLNRFHLDKWNAMAADFLAEAKTFTSSYQEVARRQEKLTASGASGRGDTTPKLGFSISSVTVMDFFDKLRLTREAGQKFDDGQRSDAIKHITTAHWPDLCEVIPNAAGCSRIDK